MNSTYTDIQISPSLAEWSAGLQLYDFSNVRLSELRRTARQRLVDSAQAYVLRLHAVAEETDLPATASGLLTGDSSIQPVVMTGHQPVVFHSGLTFKYQTTQQFAADNHAIGMAVIIDTDRGDAGQFSYPEPDLAVQRPQSGQATSEDIPEAALFVRLAVQSLADSNRLFSRGRLRPASELQQLAAVVDYAMSRVSHPAAGRLARKVLNGLAQLAASRVSAMEANTILRRHYGIGDRLLELPLSAIAAFPESLMLTVDVLKQPRRFAAAYNSALSLYREEHGIRNPANPFPDLKIAEDGCELPFWVVNHDRGTRDVLEVQLDGNVTRLLADGCIVDTFADSIGDDALDPMLLQSLQVVPRGVMITVFLRLLFSDLFVHGTGGGRYDRFTDEFIRAWWNVEPPPFTVASASRYLFSEQRSELQRLNRIRSQLRELQYNPQRYFGQDVFCAERETALAVLVDQKDQAVAAMREQQASGQSARQLGQKIQHYTNQIREAVAAEFEPQLSLLNSLAPEHHDAINSRTYPWFFFPDG